MRYSMNGFTLIELMVTLVVTAIVLSIAIPSFQSQMLNNRSIALGEDFASAINFARIEAVKRAGRVSLCASKDGETCSGSWNEGFIAFVDTVAADTTETPVVGTVLRAWKKQDSSAVISVKNGSDDKTFIRYTGLGTLARLTDKPFVISAQFKKCTGSAARQINIGLSGSVSVSRIACATE
ncbi:GspH/FimT family pseudopilin [Cellvibrio sp. OA-2007]|uniref:GspH/FimT family pseudopilin n=1 Tax=Cellvibrio sp. OA-2007 TaxID=529823 RepID=UPI0009FBE522|nr:GspH/FimT family pseudopilin [Cellvibrio sp. OA-2007]